VPIEVADLVDRALRFDKTERWPDARAMQSEVARVYEQLTGKALGAGAPLSTAVRQRNPRPDAPTLAATQQAITPSDARTTPRTTPLVGIAVGVAAALGFGLIGFLSRGGSAPHAASSGAGTAPPAASPTSPPPTLAMPTLPSPVPPAGASMAAEVPSAAPPPTALDPAAGTRPRAPAKPVASAKPAANASPGARPEADPFMRRK
jgi:hypothetical protein